VLAIPNGRCFWKMKAVLMSFTHALRLPGREVKEKNPPVGNTPGICISRTGGKKKEQHSK
jgi:hypothetical protein